MPSGKNKKRQRQREQWLNALPNYIDSETSTKRIGICEKHWPPNHEFEIVQGGVENIIHPPAEFLSNPSTFSQQSSCASARHIVEQGVTAEER